MMREFERIRIDRGAAYIRDTQITVSEIVKQAVYEKTVFDLLEQYPGLDANDIQEALAYAVGDLIEVTAIWRNEGLTPLTGVEAYSRLLASGGLTDTQRKQFTKTVYNNSHRAIAAWRNFTGWVYETYGQQPVYWHSIPVVALIDEIQRTLPQYDPTAVVEISAAGNLPDLRYEDDLAHAIANLLSEKTALFLKTTSKLNIFSEDGSYIRFQIFRAYEDPNSCTGESPDVWRGSPLALAAIIIEKHGGELQILPSAEGVTFEFQLPAWREESENHSFVWRQLCSASRAADI